MNRLRIGTAPDQFIWAGGIEDTFVPQTRPRHRALDEYELIGHYDHWRTDLALARELGIQALRWGVPWYRVEPQPQRFEWGWIDQVIQYMVETLGITPIIDLMHYGCPFWLEGAFDNPDYPDAVAAYAAAFATRYQGLVQWYTPLNEPVMNALMCGRRGVWPPYLRGDRGYVRVMMQLVRGIFKTVAALRAIQSEAVMVHVDATGVARAGDPSLAAIACEESYQNFLCYDLLTGKVTPDHPLFAWLVRNGVSVTELATLAGHPLTLDVVGVNFYPQWSTRELYLNRSGQLAYRVAEQAGEGFGEMIEMYAARYTAPIMITETSAHRGDAEREAWLDHSLAVIKHLRGQGIPVIGYTWFPITTMIDWRYRFGTAPVETYRLELGLYRLNNRSPSQRWHPTALVEPFRAYVRNPAAIGPFVAPEPSSFAPKERNPHDPA